MFKTLTTLATLASMAISPVMATSYHDRHQPTKTPHVQLFEAVLRSGVDVRVNEIRDCDPSVIGRKTYGWYDGVDRVLVVCQEEAHYTGQYGKGAFNFSEEDLDTLRHEAHHMTQDCVDNKINASLNPVYNQPIELAKHSLSDSHISRILETYGHLSDHVIVLELEAFSVAAMNNPLEQVSDIQKYCF